MPIALAFFVHYAYAILFLWVLFEQLGVPVPSIPVLLTAGTLSATHRVSAVGSVAAVLLALHRRRLRLVLHGSPLRQLRPQAPLPPLL